MAPRERPQATPGHPGHRDSDARRLLLLPPSETQTSVAEPPPRPGSPAFPGHRRPQGNKETQPSPAPRRRCLPAAGPPAASAPAAAGSAAALPLPGTWRRGGAAAGRPPAVPERGWSPRSGAKGAAGRVGQQQLPGAADGVCPPCRSRLPRRWLPGAALAHGQRCSGGRKEPGEREGRRMGETQLWVRLLFSLPSPLRGAEGGQRRGGGWANKRLGDKNEVVAAARPVRRRLPSASCFPHAWIVPASLLPPVPPSELGQAAPLSASARARQHRRCAGPSPAACSPRTFSLLLSSPPSTPPPARKTLR